jgi:hypothetical protein
MLLPFETAVIAAAGRMLTLAWPGSAERKSTSAPSSMTGAVSGIRTKLVTPPAAAASPADGEGLAIFLAGLAGEDAHVDQARGHDEAAWHR